MPLISTTIFNTNLYPPIQMARYIVGWANKQFPPSNLPLTILVNSSIQVCARILVHPIPIDTEERVVGGREAKSLSLNRRAVALASTRVCGGGEDEAYGASTGNEFDGDGWFRSGGVLPLSSGVLVWVVSSPAIFVGLISLVWVKTALGVGKTLSAVLTSSCI